MLEVPVYNTEGEKIDSLKIGQEVFGARVNVALLKQAIVAYHANRRRSTAATKSRSMVDGSTRKVYRQKGTGYARRGQLRTNLMRGGGVTFAKQPHDRRKKLTRKMKAAAVHSAVLAKILGEDLLVVEGLGMDAPRTRHMAELLGKLGIRRSCLLTLAQRDPNVYLSSRNIPDLTVRIAEELNAYDIATRQKMLVTREAMAVLMGREART
jgi:large subunit ribosomal protein L4